MADKSAVVATPHHHALLIGIDAYPTKPLMGAVRDVDEIEQYLRQAVDPLTVQTLTAPNRTPLDGPGPHHHARTRPTYKTVTTALGEIFNRAKAGDYVYIHFSGHGAIDMDEDDDKYSNHSTGDLALALLGEEEDDDDEDNPKSRRFLLGPTLAQFYLNPMVNKGLIVTLVLDCCFSASVYRRDDRNIRFLPSSKTPGITFKTNSLEVEEGREGGTALRATREPSMRLNWLMDPSRYAILSACGPGQESGEFRVNGVAHGKLSYYLRRSFNRAGGCRKTHAAIYRQLHAVFRTYERGQDPVLYGHKEQAFFGDVDTEGGQTLEVVKSGAGSLQLQAGRAHGLCTGDRLLLHSVTHDSAPEPGKTNVVAKIVQLGDLSSTLEWADETTDIGLSLGSNPSRTTWAASVLTQSSLRAYPIRLPQDLPERAQLHATLVERSLAIEDNQSTPHAFCLTSGTDHDLEIRDGRGRLLSTTTYAEAADQIEHLVRFAMVRDLTNTHPEETFQKCFDIDIMRDGKQVDSNGPIAMKGEESFGLVLKNHGPTSLFFSMYGLLATWQVKNSLKATHREVPARNVTRSRVPRPLTVTMKVPDTIQEKGLQTYDEYLKIFVTSRPSLFDSLELPELGQAVATKQRRKPDVLRSSPTPEQPEQWAAMTLHITVSM